jgi:hypothetical protein
LNAFTNVPPFVMILFRPFVSGGFERADDYISGITTEGSFELKRSEKIGCCRSRLAR